MSDIKSLLLPLLNSDETEERCGVVTKDGKIVEIDNVAQDKTKGFHMDAAQLLTNVPNAQATWHTHPDSEPNLSEEDYAGFLQYPELDHYIIGVFKGKAEVRRFYVDDGIVLQ